MKKQQKNLPRDDVKKTKERDQMICHTCSSYVPESTKDLWKPANLGKQRHKPVVNRTGKNKIS